MRKFLVTFSVPLAIVIAGGLIGAAIIAVRVVAPYQITGNSEGAWRINTITGQTDICGIVWHGCRPADDPFGAKAEASAAAPPVIPPLPSGFKLDSKLPTADEVLGPAPQ